MSNSLKKYVHSELPANVQTAATLAIESNPRQKPAAGVIPIYVSLEEHLMTLDPPRQPFVLKGPVLVRGWESRQCNLDTSQIYVQAWQRDGRYGEPTWVLNLIAPSVEINAGVFDPEKHYCFRRTLQFSARTFRGRTSYRFGYSTTNIDGRIPLMKDGQLVKTATGRIALHPCCIESQDGTRHWWNATGATNLREIMNTVLGMLRRADLIDPWVKATFPDHQAATISGTPMSLPAEQGLELPANAVLPAAAGVNLDDVETGDIFDAETIAA